MSKKKNKKFTTINGNENFLKKKNCTNNVHIFYSIKSKTIWLKQYIGVYNTSMFKCAENNVYNWNCCLVFKGEEQKF